MTQYLLRTTEQYDAFRRLHPENRQREEALAAWVQEMPLYEWVRVTWRPGQEQATIGLLCCLYLEGRINISFSRDMDYIRHEALSMEEYQDWARKRFRH